MCKFTWKSPVKHSVVGKCSDNYMFYLSILVATFYKSNWNLLCWFVICPLINDFWSKNKMIAREYCQTKQQATKHDTTTTIKSVRLLTQRVLTASAYLNTCRGRQPFLLCTILSFKVLLEKYDGSFFGTKPFFNCLCLNDFMILKHFFGYSLC